MADLSRRQTDTALMAEGLWGSTRNLFKQVLEFSLNEHPELYAQLAGRSYAELAEISDRLSAKVCELGMSDQSTGQLLIDAPPAALEVQFRVNVLQRSTGQVVPLADLSPVVRALATEQFDHYVKRIRIFCLPSSAKSLRQHKNLIAQQLCEIVGCKYE